MTTFASPSGLSPAERTTANRSLKAANFLVEQQAQERYSRLQSTVEDLQGTILFQKKRIEKLESQLNAAVKQLNTRQAAAATKEQLDALSKQFTKELEKLDAKRIADNQKILEELKKIASLPAFAPPPPEPKPEPETYTGPVFEVTVQPGNNLLAIVRKCREEGYKHVTVDAIIQANPGIKPRNLQPGQIIYIPAEE